MRNSLLLVATIIMATSLLRCKISSNSTSNGDGGNPQKPVPANRVNWSAVPSKYNPQIEEIDFRTDKHEKINLNAFGFDNDVEVIYVNNLSANTGSLNIYKVMSGSASWGYIQPTSKANTLDLVIYGSYSCSIRVTNGVITELDGGCYVRIQVLLPTGSEFEVYNLGQLITKRFIPMATEELLEGVDNATWAEDKFAVIETFLASYIGLSKKPSMTVYELGLVIYEFSRGEEKRREEKRN